MDEKKDPVHQGIVWRPINTIRPKVIGIAKQEDRLLVCEVLNDQGELKGWCPLGGGIEFGETSENALKREISEELGCGIFITGDPFICENIYEHHGFTGHDIVLAFPINFDDPEIYAKKRVQICESCGSLHWVEWIEMERFRSGEEKLFPPALINQIL
ncbi:MAG: NUDIX domain-containing protein [Gammaproteobacteria bacterium]|nr:NUDIX domain-containing protein [Gammaproteobacteria bacterium]